MADGWVIDGHRYRMRRLPWGGYVWTCADYPDLVYMAGTIGAALDGILILVEERRGHAQKAGRG